MVTRRVSSPGVLAWNTLAILTVFLGVFCILASTQGQPATKEESLQQRARMEIKIASEQVKRGLFKEAEVQLAKIRETYGTNIADRDKVDLDKLSEQVATALASRTAIIEKRRQSDQLAAEENYAGAVAVLQEIQASPYLRPAEQSQVVASIEELQAKARQYQKQVQELFNKSLRLYELKDYDKAKLGFEEVIRTGLPAVSKDGKTAQDYLVMIASATSAPAAAEPAKTESIGVILVEDGMTAAPQKASITPPTNTVYEIHAELTPPLSKPPSKPQAQPEVTPETKPITVTEPVAALKVEPVQPAAQPQPIPETKPVIVIQTDTESQTQPETQPVQDIQTPVEPVAEPAPALPKDAYLNQVLREQKIQREYTRAIVLDAASKAEDLLEKKQFSQAQQALAAAFRVVEKNRLLLGDQYKSHIDALNHLQDRINQQQTQWREAEERRIQKDIEERAKALTTEAEQQRQQAVKDYMTRARNFSEEKRFDEALGQIEQLLVVDPRNNDAMLLRQMLEDTIRWRTELQLKKESEKHEMALLVETYKQGVPYENEMNYPPDWKEIAARRKQAVSDGRSPADIAVDQQLSEVVNLTTLTEQTTLSEAVEILRNSVEPPLNMAVLWRDLNDTAFITPDTPIQMSGAGLTSIPLRTGLDRVLQAVSGPQALSPLAYTIEDGIISIATRDSLPTRFENRVYDVGELLSPPSSGYSQMGGMGGGMMGGMGG
ncbi:MAG: hypothetical protein JW828_05480, partial [Sedimentisphaerales bacterium]|nr:hypothetical protein [Sedimentisphaerales bacterium]